MALDPAIVVEHFLIGLATPLTAACALPLYPGFVVYLSNQSGDRSPALLGALVLVGVVGFMTTVAIVFSFVLQESLTRVIGTVSPVAFVVLALVSVALVLDLEVFSRLPTAEPPQDRHPAAAALGYGFFFGAIVIPCNPGTLTYLLARSFLIRAPVEKLAAFLAFGFGIGVPLLALAVVSESAGRRATRWLARRRTPINRVSGAIMLAISVYYLLTVFDLLGIGTAIGVAGGGGAP